MAKQTIQVADKPTLDEVKALLENSGYGLEQLKSLIDTANTNASNASSYANSAKSDSATNKSLLQNSTYGLQAIKNALGSIGGLTSCIKSVQNGVTDCSISGKVPISIRTVNPSKCIVIIDPLSYSNNAGYFHSLSSNTLNIYFRFGNDSDVAWQVIEFY